MLCSWAAADTGMASPQHIFKQMNPKSTESPKTTLLGVLLQRDNLEFREFFEQKPAVLEQGDGKCVGGRDGASVGRTVGKGVGREFLDPRKFGSPNFGPPKLGVPQFWGLHSQVDLTGTLEGARNHWKIAVAPSNSILRFPRLR